MQLLKFHILKNTIRNYIASNTKISMHKSPKCDWMSRFRTQHLTGERATWALCNTTILMFANKKFMLLIVYIFGEIII